MPLSNMMCCLTWPQVRKVVDVFQVTGPKQSGNFTPLLEALGAEAGHVSGRAPTSSRLPSMSLHIACLLSFLLLLHLTQTNPALYIQAAPHTPYSAL